ncbi:hypothetical protein IW147_003768 [Coemansia sp. RSA 720]|nr:hypothetical protein IW147_003768 [Coemansia sp. RSA 720]
MRQTMERVVAAVGVMGVLAVYVPICASADAISLNTYSSGLFEHLGLHDMSSLTNSDADNKSQNASAETVRDSSQGLQSCFSLEQSRYCGGWYSDYSMSALVAVGGHRVSSADELDAAMDNYFGSSDEHSYINHFFGCQSWAGQPVSRYRISYTCRSLLESKEAKGCNRNKMAPPPICASTCDMYVHEWSALTANHSMCVNNVLSEDRRRSLANGCLSWPYNGTISCVASVESDAEVCGK